MNALISITFRAKDNKFGMRVALYQKQIKQIFYIIYKIVISINILNILIYRTYQL